MYNRGRRIRRVSAGVKYWESCSECRVERQVRHHWHSNIRVKTRPGWPTWRHAFQREDTARVEAWGSSILCPGLDEEVKKRFWGEVTGSRPQRTAWPGKDFGIYSEWNGEALKVLAAGQWVTVWFMNYKDSLAAELRIDHREARL